MSQAGCFRCGPLPTLRVRRFDNFLTRMRGLIGRPPPAPGEGVWLVPCRQVHSLFMRYAVDVLHLDREGRILAVETLKPWRVSRYVSTAHSVLELASGEASRLGLAEGTLGLDLECAENLR